jgi:hypothetical protein
VLFKTNKLKVKFQLKGCLNLTYDNKDYGLELSFNLNDGLSLFDEKLSGKKQKP